MVIGQHMSRFGLTSVWFMNLAYNNRLYVNFRLNKDPAVSKKSSISSGFVPDFRPDWSQGLPLVGVLV